MARSWGKRDPGIEDLINHLNKPNKIDNWDNLDRIELAAIEGEISRCQDDFTYAARNYFMITNKDEEDILFNLWEPQELILERLLRQRDEGRPQRLMIIKARQLGCCLTPVTQVLKSDMTWTSIDALHPGDELVAIDENLSGPGRGRFRPLKKSTVLAKKSILRKAFRLTMDNGREIIATAEHRFMFRVRGSTRTEWRQVMDMVPGDAIRFAIPTWDIEKDRDRAFEDGWFGGILDGEGCLRKKVNGGSECSASQIEGPLFDKMKSYLDSRGYKYHVELDRRVGGNSSKLGNKPVAKVVINKMVDLFRLIGTTRPHRLMQKDWWEGKDLPKGGGDSWAKIVSIEELPEQPMVDIQTSTKTFIANGFVSHNSTLIEALIAWKAIFFPNSNAIIVSNEQSHCQYLFSIMTHIYDFLPWWLKPQVASRKLEKGLIFDHPDADQRIHGLGLQSEVIVQWATSNQGIGQGRRLSAAHVSEFSDYYQPKAQEIIDADLPNALPRKPHTFIVLESTAKGANNYSHRLWKSQVEMGERSDFEPCFLPWFFDKEHFTAPPKGWHEHIPDDIAVMRQRAQRDWLRCNNKDCGQYREMIFRGVVMLEQVCPVCKEGKLHPVYLTDEQLAWMWDRRENAKLKGDEALKKLKSEQCLTAEEAFQVSGIQVFPYAAREFAHSTVQPPNALGFLDANGFFHGAAVDKNGNICCFKDGCGQDHRFDDQSLQIWEFPDPRGTYVIGVDVSEGIGQDFTVASVLKVATAPNSDRQVAVWRRNDINPIDAAKPVVDLCKMYNGGLLSIEVNKYDSLFGIARFKLQYSNMYRWKHIDQTNVMTNKWGWWTTPSSKPRLYQTLTRWLNHGLIYIREANVIEEMKNFTKEFEDERAASAEKGEHDDSLMALMIALYSAHDMDWDDETGQIPIRNTRRPIEECTYEMLCKHCGHTWGSDEPHKEYCEQCGRDITIIGKRRFQDKPSTRIDWRKEMCEIPDEDRYDGESNAEDDGYFVLRGQRAADGRDQDSDE